MSRSNDIRIRSVGVIEDLSVFLADRSGRLLEQCDALERHAVRRVDEARGSLDHWLHVHRSALETYETLLHEEQEAEDEEIDDDE